MLNRLLTGAAIGLALTSAVAAQTAAPASQPAPQAAPATYVPATTVPMELITGPVTAADLPRMQAELKRVKGRLDDWPAAARYAEANKTVAPPAAGEARVVFLGDSITDAWDDPKFGGFFPGKPYINRGISGQTTPQMVLRMPADVLAHRPKAVVLLAGTNDIAGNTGPMTIEQIEGNIAMISELAAARGIKVVLSSILPTSNYHYDGIDTKGPQTVRRPLDQIRTLNSWMQEYAAQHGHVYLDYYAATVDANGMLKTELSADDLHPNATGYAIMAPLAEAAIAKALAMPAASGKAGAGGGGKANRR